jgi:hypothetical protein
MCARKLLPSSLFMQVGTGFILSGPHWCSMVMCGRSSPISPQCWAGSDSQIHGGSGIHVINDYLRCAGLSLPVDPGISRSPWVADMRFRAAIASGSRYRRQVAGDPAAWHGQFRAALWAVPAGWFRRLR